MDYMKGLPDNAFDLAIVDPPYGIGFAGEKPSMTVGLRKDGTTRVDKTWRSRSISNIKYKEKDWDNSPPRKEYFNEVLRISINQIIWGANYFTDMIPPFKGIIVWDKKAPAGFSLSDGELAAVSCSSKMRIFRYLWSGYAKEKKEYRIHPTQKPVDLYKWLLKNYAKPGQTIFDSHVGSGSIRIACHDMGYEFTGCELDPDYHAAQEDRFNTHKAQGQLFDPVELTKNEYVQVAL